MTDAHLDDEESAEQTARDDGDVDAAVQSLTETMLALRTHQERLRNASDPTLQGILGVRLSHEKEHLVMVLEWMRQRDPVLDEHMRSYFFQPSPSDAPSAQPVAPAPAPIPAPVTTETAPIPAHTPAKGVPLTFNPATRIRG